MSSHLTRFGFAFIAAVLMSVLSFASPSVSVAAVTVTGFDHEAGTSAGPVDVYHWTLQEDVMFHVTPGVPPVSPEVPLAGSFHKSHLPVVMSGTAGVTGPGSCPPLPPGFSCSDPAVAISYFQSANPEAHYFLSVLPEADFNLGGGPIKPGQTDVEIHVNQLPIPSAQISIFVFEDNQPINGAPDGFEVGLGGFEILMEEAGGKYGASAGQVLVDAFGNALGTTYNPDGSIDVVGSGRLFTEPDGRLLIKHLPPAKYGIKVVPPLVGPDSGMTQTGTIEGTKTIDAWVLANEPAFFTEFGPPGPHVFVGFSRTFDNLAGPGVTITGTVTNIHTSRQPDPTFYIGDAFGHDNCYVGLNPIGVGGAVGASPSIYAAACDKDLVDGSNLNTFEISGVPAGTYQLVIWSQFLTTIIAYKNIEVGVPAGGGPITCISQPNQSCDLQNVGVFNWFGRQENFIFADTNRNGFWDDDEVNLQAEFGTILRFRDGTIYQEIPTDLGGAAPYDVVFPFFSWFVVEVDYGAPLKATGATFVVDAGGPVAADNGWTMPSGDLLNPQPQYCTQADVDDGVTDCTLVGDPLNNQNVTPPNNLSRTETGVVLTEGFQNFLGTTNIAHWGKVPYQNGENGGISGVVFYGVTRAENDPAFGAGEPWEPGIPRVQVNLYEDTINFFDLAVCELPTFPPTIPILPLCNPTNPTHLIDGDFPFGAALGRIKDQNSNGTVDLADVDNYPLGWNDGTAPMGPEDVDNNTEPNGGTTGGFDLGDALEATYTDSWDDSLPTGCTKDVLPEDVAPGNEPFSLNGVELDCYDGLRNYNQMRPAVFDGGYAFGGLENDYDAVPGDGPIGSDPGDIDHQNDGDTTTDNGGLPVGFYIVETVTPPGYARMKEEDQNVALGLEVIPTPEALPQQCVGDVHTVPEFISLQTDSFGAALPGVLEPESAPFALEDRKLCDRKGVHLASKQNAAADFWLLTKAPIAALGKGFILNDLANEFDPLSPQFGEKYAPPFMPIALRDWNGREISRFYSDEFGNYNMPTPSTFSANVPNPSGFSPGMFFVCMNDKGPIPLLDELGDQVVDAFGNPVFESDPAHDKRFSQFCYPLQFMPGSTTYLDTPVVPVAAFTGSDSFPLDCDCEDGSPAIALVNGPEAARAGGSGPWMPRNNTNNLTVLVIESMGKVEVPNPAYEGPNTGTAKTILRDYGFGPNTGLLSDRKVTLARILSGNVSGATTELNIIAWNKDQIIATVPRGIGRRNNREYQLMVTRGDNSNTSKSGITFTVRNPAGSVFHVDPDLANPSATPIQAMIDNPAVGRGDLIVIHPGHYTENVVLHKPVKLQCSGPGSTFINVPSLVGSRRVAWMEKVEALDIANAFDLLPEQEATRAADGIEAGLGTEAGAGILVLANISDNRANRNYRIDGCSITGADNAGGIVVNGFVRNMTISNNYISNNYGVLGGGVRFGNPTLLETGPPGPRVFTNVVINGDADNGSGGTTMTTATPHNFLVGDIVRIRRFSGASGYNGLREVTAVPSATSFDIAFLTTGLPVPFCTASCGRGGPNELARLVTPIPSQVITDAMNDGARIRYNLIRENGSAGFAGGGVGLYAGTGRYQVTDNFICGNFTQGHGAGIAHLGFSDGRSGTSSRLADNRIVDNTIIFNQSFNQGQTRHGGGIFVGGLSSSGPLGLGSGSVLIDSNLIQGNMAGTGEGGGISLSSVNGQDQGANRIDIINNRVVNNVAGLRAGGISLFDAVDVDIVHNTIANNDSTATHGNLFDFVANASTPQPAGIVSHAHSAGLGSLSGQSFANPRLIDNIITHNRSFKVVLDDVNFDLPQLVLFPDVVTTPASVVYDDLAVIGTGDPTDVLSPVNSILSFENGLDDVDALGAVVNIDAYLGNGNLNVDPLFVNGYSNGSRASITIPEATTTIVIQGAFDEGGNFIDMQVGPLTINAVEQADLSVTPAPDYHIDTGSPALDAGTGVGGISGLASDMDDDGRPLLGGPDIGADERTLP